MDIITSDGGFSDDFRDAFEKFYNDNYPPLYKHAKHILDDEVAAKNVVGGVFADLLSKLRERTLDMRKIEITYVKACVRNACFDYYNKKKREQSSQTDIAKMTRLEVDFTIEKEISDELHYMLRKLDPTLRMTMELLYLQEMDHASVAAVMNVALPTVYARKKRALKILKELYRKILSIWCFVSLLFPMVYKN